jgi:PAS domain S-box-containing protein
MAPAMNAKDILQKQIPGGYDSQFLINKVRDYAIFMLSPEGYILNWNEGAKAIKGYEPEEIIGQHFSIFYPQDAKERNFPAYELEVAKQQGRFEDEGWRVRKDGTLFWANVVITTLFSPEGELIGFTKITRDLTERKRITDELEQAKNKAEMMNAELEALAYSISHDLRAPLRSIDGFSKLIAEEKAHLLDDEGKDYIERVTRNAQLMNQLLTGLLTLSRISRAELFIANEDLSIQAESICAKLKTQDPKRKVEFQIQKNIFQKADLVLIRTVLENLLSNAWKFTAKTETSIIEFGTIKKDNKVVFFVRDNGVGFESEKADRLFGAFQRFHNSENFPGIGMGLAIAKRIIHRHKGEIWVESKPDDGTTVYFTLNS